MKKHVFFTLSLILLLATPALSAMEVAMIEKQTTQDPKEDQFLLRIENKVIALNYLAFSQMYKSTTKISHDAFTPKMISGEISESYATACKLFGRLHALQENKLTITHVTGIIRTIGDGKWDSVGIRLTTSPPQPAGKFIQQCKDLSYFFTSVLGGKKAIDAYFEDKIYQSYDDCTHDHTNPDDASKLLEASLAYIKYALKLLETKIA